MILPDRVHGRTKTTLGKSKIRFGHEGNNREGRRNKRRWSCVASGLSGGYRADFNITLGERNSPTASDVFHRGRIPPSFHGKALYTRKLTKDAREWVDDRAKTSRYIFLTFGNFNIDWAFKTYRRQPFPRKAKPERKLPKKGDLHT